MVRSLGASLAPTLLDHIQMYTVVLTVCAAAPKLSYGCIYNGLMRSYTASFLLFIIRTSCICMMQTPYA